MINFTKKVVQDDMHIHIAKWALLLTVFWLLLSGFLKPLLLFFGMVSVLVTLIILKRMDNVDNEPQQLGTGIRFIRYLPWLIGQIFSSSLHVTKLIWGSTDRVSPTLARINAENVPHNCRALYANSITLTPGTLSVDLMNGEVTVHALQKSSIDELEGGFMEKKITSIWGVKK